MSAVTHRSYVSRSFPEKNCSPAVALSLATLFWAGNFVAGRALRGQIDPLTLNFVRWLVAFVVLAPFVWRDLRANIAVVLREWRLLLGLGATGISTFHTLNYIALQTTTATNALLILSTAPIAILVGATATGNERLHTPQVIGTAASVFGAAVLITRGNLFHVPSRALNPGDLWMCASFVLWAAYSLLLRRRPANLPHTGAFAGSIAVALAIMTPILATEGRTDLAAFASIPVLLAVGYIAVFASALAFLFCGVGPTGSHTCGAVHKIDADFRCCARISSVGGSSKCIGNRGRRPRIRKHRSRSAESYP
jgi:drug/metabolite transporter (DMT)-like permease